MPIYVIIILFIFAGCQSYQAKPIIPNTTLENVEQSRNQLLAELPADFPEKQQWDFTFLNAIQLLSKNNVVLKQAYAEYKQAQRFANIKTPLPNPQLQAGTLIGSNLGNDDSGRVQPLVNFGFTVPLGGRLSKQDSVNETIAKYSFLKYVLQHRKEYLSLRKLYITFVLLEEKKQITERVLMSIQSALDVTQKLIAAGFATALDIGIIELELLQKQSELAQIESELTQMRGQLSQILGISSQLMITAKTDKFPDLLETTPELTELKGTALKNNFKLTLLQATYEIAEKKLELEISKQTPDVTINSSLEGDPGDDKKFWGFSLSFPIPIFDKNERAIVTQENQRELVRVQYEGALNNTLASLETAHERYLQQQKIHNISSQALKKAQANVAIASETLRKGELEFLRYVDSERSLRDVLLEVYEAKFQMYQAWLEIEEIIGQPILLFPQEKSEDIPSIANNRKSS